MGMSPTVSAVTIFAIFDGDVDIVKKYMDGDEIYGRYDEDDIKVTSGTYIGVYNTENPNKPKIESNIDNLVAVASHVENEDGSDSHVLKEGTNNIVISVCPKADEGKVFQYGVANIKRKIEVSPFSPELNMDSENKVIKIKRKSWSEKYDEAGDGFDVKEIYHKYVGSFNFKMMNVFDQPVDGVFSYKNASGTNMYNIKAGYNDIEYKFVASKNKNYKPKNGKFKILYTPEIKFYVTKNIIKMQDAEPNMQIRVNNGK